MAFSVARNITGLSWFGSFDVALGGTGIAEPCDALVEGSNGDATLAICSADELLLGPEDLLGRVGSAWQPKIEHNRTVVMIMLLIWFTIGVFPCANVDCNNNRVVIFSGDSIKRLYRG